MALARIMASNHGIAVMLRPIAVMLTTSSRRRELMLGALIWLAFAIFGIGILYWLSILSGD